MALGRDGHILLDQCLDNWWDFSLLLLFLKLLCKFVFKWYQYHDTELQILQPLLSYLLRNKHSDWMWHCAHVGPHSSSSLLRPWTHQAHPHLHTFVICLLFPESLILSPSYPPEHSPVLPPSAPALTGSHDLFPLLNLPCIHSCCWDLTGSYLWLLPSCPKAMCPQLEEGKGPAKGLLNKGV